jgi:SAM-dependent methyltransferase
MWLANRLFPSVRRLAAEVEERRALGPALPPPELRRRAGGAEDADGFLLIGAALAWDIHRLLQAQRRPLSSFGAVLDFGCGCGRIGRWLRLGHKLSGCDIDEEAVAWCSSHLQGSFAQTGAQPPLPYVDGAFDLVVAISVFTHLDEEREAAWVAELGRVIRPGGFCIASVNGCSSWALQGAVAGPAYHDQMSVKGFTSGPYPQPGMPSWYQNSYHRPDYVERYWTKDFEILTYEERAINHHQDAVVMRRR